MAIMYIVFIAIVPIISVGCQFATNDSLMYLSYLVAGCALTYDYVILFRASVCKRLWIEAAIAAVCFVVVLGIAVFKLTSVLTFMSEQGKLNYNILDLCLVSVVCIMPMIDCIELGYLLKHDYMLRYGSGKGENLIEGAKNI